MVKPDTEKPLPTVTACGSACLSSHILDWAESQILHHFDCNLQLPRIGDFGSDGSGGTTSGFIMVIATLIAAVRLGWFASSANAGDDGQLWQYHQQSFWFGVNLGRNLNRHEIVVVVHIDINDNIHNRRKYG